MNFERMPIPNEGAKEDTLEEREQPQLTPALRAIVSMDLNFSPEEYRQKALGGQQIESREVSEDAFLRIAKSLISGGRETGNSWSAMLNILERESMKGHPQIEVFKQAVQDIAELRKRDLKLPEGYWDNLK